MRTRTHARDSDASVPDPDAKDSSEPDSPDTEASEAEEPEESGSEKSEAEESEDEESEDEESEESKPEAAEAEVDAAKETGKRTKAGPKLTKKPSRSHNSRTAALVLTTVALLCAAWFGWSWYGAAHDESLQFSGTRDEVLRAGEQAVLNLNTLDYRTLNQGLKLWQDSSTSELYQEIVQGRTAFEREVKSAKTITSAKVLDAAVTELDEHSGKAGVIVGLQITVTPPKGAPVIKKTRLMGELTRTSTGWKLSALAQAPAGATG